MKKTAGRKTVITQTVLRKLEEAFLLGCTDREACLYANISETALYDYQSKNKPFTERKRMLKTNPVLQARKTVMKSLDNPKIATWYLERRCNNEFSTKSYITQEEVDQELTEEEKNVMKELLAREGIAWSEESI